MPAWTGWYISSTRVVVDNTYYSGTAQTLEPEQVAFLESITNWYAICGRPVGAATAYFN